MGEELFNAGRQTDRQIDMIKLTVAISNYATAPTVLKKYVLRTSYREQNFFLVIFDWSVHAT